MKRKFALIMLCILTVAALAGCQSKEPEYPALEDPKQPSNVKDATYSGFTGSYDADKWLFDSSLGLFTIYDKEVYAYVYRENIVLSLIGTLTGLVLGIFLHMFVIYTVEVDATMFGRSIKFWSYAASAGLTILFSLRVNLAMRRKLRNISMVESMKAPE